MGLVDTLMQNLNVSDPQARGGAGLIFKAVKDRLGAGDFAKVAQAVPEASDLMAAAPTGTSTGLGALGSLAGSLGSAAGGLGGLAGLAGGFTQLGLGSGMIGKFVSLIVSYVQSKGGAGVGSLLEKALQPGVAAR